MLELNCTCLTIDKVLQTSGHVAKFADYMVKDVKNGQCHRADKLIDEFITKLILKKAKTMKPEERQKLEKVKLECDNYGPEQLN